METMHLMTSSFCGGSFDWMLYTSYVGFFGCGLFAIFHLTRMALAKIRHTALDYKSEFGHALMQLGMAYMFMPNLTYHFIPDTYLAILFAYLALCYALRLALQPGSKLGRVVEALHATMSLGMAYTFLPEAWQQVPVVPYLFLAAYASYGTIYGALLVDATRQFRSGRSAGWAQANAVAYGVSHVFMALGMIYMALMPSLMSASMPMSMPM